MGCHQNFEELIQEIARKHNPINGEAKDLNEQFLTKDMQITNRCMKGPRHHSLSGDGMQNHRG
jgi:hypothetical protein